MADDDIGQRKIMAFQARGRAAIGALVAEETKRQK